MSRVFVDSDGAVMVLVTGSTRGGFGVERFTPEGALDMSFGSSGVRWLTSSVQNQAEGVFDKQGRIIVLGRTAAAGEPAVARFLPSGQPDLRFGRSGVARVASLGDAEPLHIAAEPGGALVVAGYGASPSGANATRVLLARLMSSGAPDRGFGRRGVIEVSSAFTGLDALAVAPDRGIVLATSIHHGIGAQAADELLVARYTPKGPDRAFGVHGLSRRTMPVGPGRGLSLHAIATERNGNAVLVGEDRERSVDVPRGHWFIARYTPHGLDCSFGSSGSVDGEEGGADSVAVQQDQRIVIAGWGPGHLPSGAGTAFMAARYIGGGHGATCPGGHHRP